MKYHFPAFQFGLCVCPLCVCASPLCSVCVVCTPCVYAPCVCVCVLTRVCQYVILIYVINCACVVWDLEQTSSCTCVQILICEHRATVAPAVKLHIPRSKWMRFSSPQLPSSLSHLRSQARIPTLPQLEY